MKQKMKKQTGRILSFMMAMIMVCCMIVIPAVASEDWTDLVITLRWNLGDSELSSAAVPVETVKNTFWACVDANALNSLIIDMYHPTRSFQFDPISGSVLENVIPAGEYVDGNSFITITAYDENGGIETFYLYISTVTPVPMVEVTVEPTEEPTPEPTAEPTEEPTAEPTAEPTEEPTEEPTPEPTAEPTAEPTTEPTAEPTEEPTAEPTEEPTPEPTAEPTVEPTAEPIVEPTEEPTVEMTVEATAEPTEEPTAEPTPEPTAEPTIEPTAEPIPEFVVADIPSMENLSDESITNPSADSMHDENTMTGTVMVERYGLTNAKKVNIRKGMSTSTSAIGQISDPSTYVFVISDTLTDNGEHWLNITVDSVTGYVKGDFIDILTPEENEAYLYSISAAIVNEQPSEQEVQPSDDEKEISADTLPDQITEQANDFEQTEPMENDVPTVPEIIPEQKDVLNDHSNDFDISQDPYETPDSLMDDGNNEITYDMHDDIIGANEGRTEEDEVPAIEGENEPLLETVEPAITPFAVETPIPTGAYINRFGMITDKQVGFRMDMSASSTLIKRFAKGSYVYVIVEKVNDAGENWYYVEDNGQFGYIMSKFVEVLTAYDSDSIMLGLCASPVPEVTPEPLTTPDGHTIQELMPEMPDGTTEKEPELTPDVPVEVENTEPEFMPDVPAEKVNTEPEFTPDVPAEEENTEPEITPDVPAEVENTEPESIPDLPAEKETTEPEPQKVLYTPAPTPVETVIPAGTMINRFGIINAKQVAFREAMNTEKAPISRLAKGDYVYLLREETNDAGDQWYLIEIDGRDGYVMKKFVEVMTQLESDEVTEKECETPVPRYVAPGVTEGPFEQPDISTEEKTDVETDERTSHTDEAENEAEGKSGETGYTENPEQGTETEVPEQVTSDEEEKQESSLTPLITEPPVETPTQTPIETPTPVPTETPTQVPTETPTQVPTETPTQAPTETPTQAPVETPNTLIDVYKGYALVRQKTSLMSAPNGETKGELPPTTLVEVLDQEYGTDGNVWSSICTLENQSGFVPDSLLSPISDDNAKTLIDQWSILHATPTPVPTAAPTVEPQQVAGYAVTLGDGVYLRDYPASAGMIRSELNAGRVLYVTGQFYENGTIWHQVYDEGVWGYVRADMLRMMNEAEVKAYNEKLIVTAEPVIIETPAPFTGESMSSYGYVTAATASLCSNASADASVIASLKQYAFCLIQSMTNDGTQVWYKVWINGNEGYVSSNYFKQLTADELTQFLNSPEYQEGINANKADENTDLSNYIMDAEDWLMNEWNDVHNTDNVIPYVQPTPEPYQRQGYAITIGDGVYVRSYPDATSMILNELPANKVVYVIGQTYQDEVAWHEVVNNGEWGYIRADMLRIMSESEVEAYINNINNTPEPTPDITPEPYSGEDWSSYGYVESRSVNFRERPTTNSAKIGTLKQYAFCLILGIENNENQTWYKVWYNGQTGYVSGDYFKQLTVDEMNTFRQSKQYLQGIEDNKKNGTETTDASTFVSAEDQTVRVWTNPESGINVSYAPFDPFATAAPLPTETPVPVETDAYEQVIELTEEGMEESETYSPLATTEPGNDNSEGSSAGTFLLVAAAVLLLGGGGYAAFMVYQNKKKAAQREAERRAKAAKLNSNAMKPENRNITAQEAARANRVRTGTYTNTAGTSVPSAVPIETNTRKAEKPLGNTGNTMYNPYGRYTTPKQDELKAEHFDFEPRRAEPLETKEAQDAWQNNTPQQPTRRRRTDAYNHSGEDE